MIRVKVEIAIGARFKMSALGAARCPRLADREGMIVGVGQYRSTVRVIFDGSKSPMSLHRDYIDPVELGRTRPNQPQPADDPAAAGGRP